MTTFTAVSRFGAAIATVFIGTVATGFSISPAAANGLNGPAITVKFRDLDMSTPQGAEMLYARIRAAAYDVCLEFDSRHNMSALVQRDDCVGDVILTAVTKINNPVLSAVYGAKTGREVPQGCTAADGSSRHGSREGSRHGRRSA